MNNLKSNKFIAATLAFVLVMSLAGLPLPAEERRGSTVEVTMIDGSHIKGELLAVKSDTLLVYDPNACQGKSLDLQQVAQVKLFKKPRFSTGMIIGLGVGVLSSLNISSVYAVFALFTAAAASLLGGIIGGIASMPEKFSLPGESSRTLQQNLERLKRYARERDSEKVVAPLFADKIASDFNSQSHEAKRQYQFRHRFRLLWSPGKQKISGNSDFHGENGSFWFRNKFWFSSKDTAVYPFKLDTSFYPSSNQQRIGQLRLEYELTPHFSSGIEFDSAVQLEGLTKGYFSYYSVDYAMQCESLHYIHTEYSKNSLLLGLNWKPFTPSFARKHSIELGIAVGLAQVQVKYRHNLNSYQKSRAFTWSGKVHAAYDYFHTEYFSLGIFAEYQYLRASLPSTTLSDESVLFEFKRDSYHYGFSRQTDVTIPGHSIQLEGLAYGLRVGLRF